MMIDSPYFSSETTPGVQIHRPDVHVLKMDNVEQRIKEKSGATEFVRYRTISLQEYQFDNNRGLGRPP
jgi:hypothetical protein